MNALFKVRAPKKTLSCIFQAIGNVLLQKVQSQCDYAQATPKVKVKKEWIEYGGRFALPCYKTTSTLVENDRDHLQ